jgi:hypothetical protein
MFLIPALMIGLVSCSEETLVSDTSSEKGNARTLEFSIGLPGSEPVTYVVPPPREQVLSEYKIETLDVYEFDCSGGPTEDALLKKVYTKGTKGYGLYSNQDVYNTYLQLELQLDAEDVGPRFFLFVANAGGTGTSGTADDLTLWSVNDSLTAGEFMQSLSKEITTNEPASPFLMTGTSETINLVKDASYSLNTVWMTRTVARLDLETSLTNTNDSLEITSIRMNNVPSATYLYPTSPTINPSASTAYAAKTAANSDFLFEDFGDRKLAKRVFYFYERDLSQFADYGTPTVYVEGRYKPQNGNEWVLVRYEIPFDRSIVRNYIYTVSLTINNTLDGYKGALMGIRTEKWQEEVIANDVALLKVTVAVDTTGDYSYDASTHT